MKIKTLLKNTFRDIWRSRGRFLSILLIVALGTGFFTGVKASSPDMIRNIDNYFEEYQLMDLHYQSSIGFTSRNINDINNLESVDIAIGKYHVDAITNLGSIDELVIRVHSYNPFDQINNYELVEGRFPVSNKEIVIEYNSNFDYYQLGELIKLDGDGLIERDYEIVGYVRSPMYLNYERSRTSLGGGFVDFYAVTLTSAFDLNYFTDVFIKLNSTKNLSTYDDLYLGNVSRDKEGIFGLIKSFDQNAQYYQYDRTNISGYSNYYEDSQKVDSIANVFPVFFILLAILVTLSSMTRMVAEQRIEIGSLASLGSSKGYIISKYIIYAIIATFFGSVIGVTIGMLAIPQFIYNAFAMSYILPKLTPYYRWDYFGINIIIAISATELATIFACFAILKSNPANLLRAKAPKAGRKTLVEKFGFIWKRIGFNSKMTIRNLFRYKGRTLITIIGIAGCTGLMLTGFGFYNAITKMGEKQFEDIFKYDGIAILNPYISVDGLQELENKISQFDQIDGYLFAFQDEASIRKGNDDFKATIIVPRNVEEIYDYIELKNRKTKQTLDLNDGIVVSEKLAKLLNIKVNDNLTFTNVLGNRANLKVVGITENYTNHFIYLSPQVYKAELNDYIDNSIFMKFSNNDFYEEFKVIENVLSIIFSEDNQEVFSESADNLTSVVIVIIISSALLAIVVLYNLANINITERSKELSTFKVLGMTDVEVTLYIARENIFSTAIGIGVGLLIGFYFVDYVIKIVEYPEIMFIQDINVGSYIYTSLLTILFASIVSIFSHWRLKGLDMVEAMKAIE